MDPESNPSPPPTEDAEAPAIVCKLPSFPPIAMRLMQVLSREDADVQDAVKLIESDPAFGVEILQLANSPLFGCSARINSVRHAVVLVGLERTKSLSMTVAMRSYLKRSAHADTVRRVWRHTLACALLSQEFCRLASVVPDRAYTAGMLHDVGRLGLLAAYADKYGPLLLAEYASCGEVLDAERTAFEVDHCEAGFWLSRTWGLPAELCDVARYHHLPAERKEFDTGALVHLSCLMADSLGFEAVKYQEALSVDQLRESLPSQLRHRFDFDVDGLKERLVEQIGAFDGI